MHIATDWKERIAEGEAAQLERLAEDLRALQRARAAKGTVRRGLHAKGQVGIEATFEVLADVPASARVGMFATPGVHRAYVRVSNGDPGVRHDGRPDVRGLAVKVLDVPGRKLIPGLEDARTQDFLAIRAPSQPFPDATEFVWFVKSMGSPATLVPKLIFRYGPGRAIRLLKTLSAGLSEPMRSVAETSYWSALPIRFGEGAAKYQFLADAPATAPLKLDTPDAIAAELAARLAKGPVSWTFRAQFFQDEKRTPIEDASVEWREADAPFVPLAKLTVAQQDLSSPRAQKLAAFVEQLSFDPWHAPVEFRPVGQMMRARNAAYRLSTQERRAAPEPDGSESFA